MYSLLLREAQLHGIKRLEDKKYRWYWGIALILLMGVAISIMLVLLNRFQGNPTNIMRLELFRDTPIKFPAVLLFPEIDYPKYKVDAFFDQFDESAFPEGLNRSHMEGIIRQLAAFYAPDDAQFNLVDLENVERFLHRNHLGVEEVALNLTTSCEEALLRCRWRGVTVNCSTLFKLEMCQSGYCCVFNGRSLKRELENGVIDVDKGDGQKFLTNDVGYTSGLMFVVNQSVFDLYDMDLDYKWFAMTTHQRYINGALNGTPISPGKEVWFGYEVEGFHIAEDTKFLSDTLRRCTLSTEKLKYFPLYHTSYCVLECGIREVFTHCHCILHNQPAPLSVPRCRANQLMCAQVVLASVATSGCGCLSTCDYVENHSDVSEYVMCDRRIPVDSFYEGLDYGKITIIRVFLSTREVYLKLRKPYFGQIDLYAQMGGVFNVIFGCSVLSLLELLQLAWYKYRQTQVNNQVKPKGDVNKKSKKALEKMLYKNK